MEALIREPLKEVDFIFEECKHEISETMCSVFKFFHDKLEFSAANRLKIPILNSTEAADLPSLTLVRFRGIIQDMYDPEYFIPCYERDSRTRTSLFRDPVDIREEEFSCSVGKAIERSTWHVVEIPGENPWVNRGFSRMSMNNSEIPGERMKVERTEPSNEIFHRPRCFPLETNKRSCLVKCYKTESAKLNDVVEVVGVLSHLPEGPPSIGEADSDEFNFKNPPTWLVPRIHAVYIKELHHQNPFLDYNIALGSAAERRYVLTDALKCRQELLEIFTPLFYGDEHCADYLLMHLISRIAIREGLFAVGKFSLNLRGVSEEQGQAIAEILSLLVTNSHYMPMKREYLNIVDFVPKKDLVTNRLQAGVLQLSTGTVLICDENSMTSGQLNHNGVTNVKALQNVVESQNISYDFIFHTLDFETDIPVLYISTGKGLIRCDYETKNIAMQPKRNMAEIVESIKQNLTDTILKRLRIYITVVKWEDYKFSDEMKVKVEEDFAEMRSTGSRMSADQLHSHLVVAKYQALLHGETELTVASWERAKALEKERNERVGL